tara:strand:- start:599 stop:991 length:393 start_codon:yes stop_codon:yes gene_type:complete
MNFQNNWVKSYISNNIWHIDFGKSASENDFLSFIEFYQSAYNNIQKTYIIFNALQLEQITIKQCYKLALMMQNMRPIHKQKLECFAIIVNSPLILHILRFVFSIVPPVRPYIIVNNNKDAYTYINDYSIL